MVRAAPVDPTGARRSLGSARRSDASRLGRLAMARASARSGPRLEARSAMGGPRAPMMETTGERAGGAVAIEVCIETGSKKVFASALAWPGWSRSAKDEAGALAALADYA